VSAGRVFPRLARLATIPELAVEQGVNRKTMRRRILALIEADRARGRRVDWCLYSTSGGERMHVRINRTMLRARHPEIFEAEIRPVSELEDRLETLEAEAKSHRDSERRFFSYGARLRKLEERAA
jgi:alpha-D-ribose 1-methylphosphonate 5-triphosphate synthase subunit PhnL